MASEKAMALRAINGVLSEILVSEQESVNALREIKKILVELRKLLERWDEGFKAQAQRSDAGPDPRVDMDYSALHQRDYEAKAWDDRGDGFGKGSKVLVGRPDYSPLPTGEVVCMVDCPQCHGRIRIDFGDEALMESAFMHGPKDQETGG